MDAASGTISKWKLYPMYKKSGVDWLGEVPEHWEVKRLRFICKINPTKSELYNLASSTTVSFLPMEAISENGLLNLEETRNIEQVWQGYTHFKDNDVIIAKITPCFENGKGALCKGLLGGIGFGTTELQVLQPSLVASPEFIFYVTKSHPFRSLGIGSMQGAAGQKRVTDDFIKDFIVGLPQPVEQCAIAAFLDRETSKIDAIIAKKERLIELLLEKRTALISHSVTKGLDPSVPMKDTGVEWLGEIPANWLLMHLKFLLLQHPGAIKTGPFGSQLLSSEMNNGEIKVYNQKNVIERNLSEGNNYISKDKFKELSSFSVFSGDILVTTRGTIGRCVIVPETIEPGILHPCLMRIQPNEKKVLKEYLTLLIQDSIVIITQLLLMSSATTIDVIYSNTLRNIIIPLPPLTEQRQIIWYLEKEAEKINILMLKTNQTIEKMKEYRIALISAAVTGKIDVRNEVGGIV